MTASLPQPAGIAEFSGVDAHSFRKEIAPLGQPAVLRGLVAHWPAVGEGGSPESLVAYLKGFYGGHPVAAMEGAPSIGGRYFYKPDMSGLNFTRRPSTLDASLDQMLAHLDDAEPPALSVQSTPAAECLPGFAEANTLDLPPSGTEPRIWIGNRLTVATHFDLSANIACVVAGRRRFTLFPPQQTPNLYLGPFELSPAGVPVSMVDTAAPDLERFPRFREAMAAAQTAELEPGDAIYIPYFWWHEVRSLERFNMLVNYWWSEAEPPFFSPFDAMLMSLVTFAEMPEAHRQAWRTMFEHIVFRAQGQPMAHLPPPARGALGGVPAEAREQMRQVLIRALSKG